MYTIAYYSIIKRNEFLIDALTGMNLANFILIEKARHKRPYINQIIQNVQNRQIHRGRDRLKVSNGWEDDVGERENGK